MTAERTVFISKFVICVLVWGSKLTRETSLEELKVRRGTRFKKVSKERNWKLICEPSVPTSARGATFENYRLQSCNYKQRPPPRT